MTAPIEDVSALPGTTVYDQGFKQIGTVDAVYATEDGFPMWIDVQARRRHVMLPLARLKDEGGQVVVPYSLQHVLEAPEIDTTDGISVEADADLRGFFAIDLADGESRTDNCSYVTLAAAPGTAHRVEDPSGIKTPSADQRTEDTRERLQDPGPAEARHITIPDP